MTTIDMKDVLPLTAEEVRGINSYWRAANYLSVGQIYLSDNPLLREPLKLDHVKRRLLGHWGTTRESNRKNIGSHCFDSSIQLTLNSIHCWIQSNVCFNI